jgi:TonB family protein
MHTMFTQPTQIPRSPLASTLTVVFHVCLALVVTLITAAAPSIPRIVRHEPLTFIAAAPAPDLEFEIPKPLERPRFEPPRPEPPKVAEAPVIIEKPPAPTPKPAEPRVIEPPKEPAPKPQVVVGAFADAAAAKRPERLTEVTPAGFDSSAAQTSRQVRQVAAVEGFETNLPPSRRANATGPVASAGFGETPAASAPRHVARATGAAGFGAEPAPPAAAARPTRTVSQTGFGDTPQAAPKPVPAAPKPPQADRPVEVLSKPAPAYTEEARAQRVEGEVSLEVEFTADGQVRVLRVVRGLGYGLDEMAAQAAQRIRFRPATSKGVPVDFRATLTILFRLT